MTEKQEKLIFQFEELFEKLKELVNENIPAVQCEKPQQEAETEEKQDVFSSEFMEIFGILKDFVEKNIIATQDEFAQQTVEEDVEPSNEQIPELDKELSQIQIEEIDNNSEIKELATKIAEILSLIKVSNHKDEINKELHAVNTEQYEINKALHKELQLYKNDFRREITYPVLKSIIRWHEKLSEQYVFYEEKLKEENANTMELFSTLLNEYRKLAGSLENLLYRYDIEPDRPTIGTEFNPDKQDKISVVPTNDTELDGKIAECISCGFHDRGNKRVLSVSKKTHLFSIF